jgi:hypothetical protein
MTTSNIQQPTPNTQRGRNRGFIGGSMFDVGCSVFLNIQFTACLGGGFAPKRLLAGGGPLFSPFTSAAALSAAQWNN